MFKEDLETIDALELCKTDRINYRILKDVLETYLEGYRWRRWVLRAHFGWVSLA